MKNLGILFIALLLFSCNADNNPDSLKRSYNNFFSIGAAIGEKHLSNYDTVLLKMNFSSLTAENDMKPGRTINKNKEFTYEAGDKIVEFAERNDMEVRGHTLIWYNQTDDWFYRDSLGNYLTKDALFERMEWYIQQVLTHYGEKVYCWDVVNEAISDLDDKFYRDDIDWFKVGGPEYIEKAFIYARQANPEVKLFYNDYDLINPKKAEKVYQMLKDFQERGIPVDGVGMQGHWTMEDVNRENLSKSIDLFASLGLDVQITELDISIYPYYHNMDKKLIPKEVKEFTEELEIAQAEKYKEVFEVFVEKSDKISSVTFWGVADNKTWLSNYIIKGRTDHPLLFDAEYKPKKAFEYILEIEK